MNAPHDVLVQQAREALERVFSDQSVPPEVTRADLETLAEEIAIWVDSLPATPGDPDE